MAPVVAVIGFSGFALGEQDYRTDSETPYVHRIHLFDEEGDRIDPSDRFEARPYSVSVTCGKCHDIEAIRQGWHFNATDDDINSGRPGEPWFYVDGKTGTSLPLTHRDWPGTYDPAEFGMDDWELIREFGRHHPGGGAGLPDAETAKESHEGSRWPITGSLEIDCMICHSARADYDGDERAQQIEDENYKWAASAAAGLASVRGDTKDVPEDFDPEFPELSLEPVELPLTLYEPSRFDSSDRVLFDLLREPNDDRCLFCHTVRRVDERAPAQYLSDWDVHTRAGMRCADCHRHGLDHRMMRGYEGESREGVAESAVLTCRSCHIAGEREAGRLGAPIAEHRGIPPLHFESMSCTSCHSGPAPEAEGERVQTAMAHGLGLAEEGRSEAAWPWIAQTVLARDGDGLIAPHRAVWPAFWGIENGDGAMPVKPAPLSRLPVVAPSEGEGEWISLSDEMIRAGLSELAANLEEGNLPVYVASGRVHRLQSGELTAERHEVAEPYLWPIAHPVRGAALSTGARGCRECHSNEAPFFFGSIEVASGPFVPEARERVPMLEFFGADAARERRWNLLFRLRPLYKLAGFAAASLLFFVVWTFAGVMLRSWARERDREPLQSRSHEGGGRS